MQQVSLHHTPHCRVFTSSPVLRVFLLPNWPRHSSPPRARWAQSRTLTGSLRLGSPSSLPTPSCCSSASSQAGTSMENTTAASLDLQHRQTTETAPAFPISGLCICLCLPLGIDMRLVGHLPWANVCTEKWSLTGTVSVLGSKPDCSRRYEQKYLYFTTHITVHKVIWGTPSPYARLLCLWAHTLAQLSSMQMV